jgi:hypothetical protein
MIEVLVGVPASDGVVAVVYWDRGCGGGLVLTNALRTTREVEFDSTVQREPQVWNKRNRPIEK